MSIMFNEICIYEEMLPKYTYIYIYIYIYIHLHGYKCPRWHTNTHITEKKNSKKATPAETIICHGQLTRIWNFSDTNPGIKK